jgi:hypothetical protein
MQQPTQGEVMSTLRNNHMPTRLHRVAAGLVLSLPLALAVPLAQAQTDAPPPKLAAGSIETKASGRIELQPETHMPLFVEFDRSPALTQVLASALEAQGVSTTTDRSAAKAALFIRGDVVLMGGPVFHKGAKVAMGEATERTLAASAANRTPSAGEAANTAVGVALSAAALKSATTPFWSGLAVSRMADVLGEATGIKGAFNTALTGDPRGICLSRCEDWKKVKQTAYAFVTFTSPDGKQELRVLASAVSETLAPEEVVAEALSKAVGAITPLPASTKP